MGTDVPPFPWHGMLGGLALLGAALVLSRNDADVSLFTSSPTTKPTSTLLSTNSLAYGRREVPNSLPTLPQDATPVPRVSASAGLDMYTRNAPAMVGSCGVLAALAGGVMVLLRRSSTHDETCAMLAASTEGAASKKVSKPRLPALDSIRFFLIIYIVCGHFIQMCVTNPTLLQLFTQINVVVGAFFVLSGYVAGYTGSTIGKREADSRLFPTHVYVIGKVMGYYPLHLLILLLFTPMFLYADVHYNGWFKAITHGLMSLSLTQSWFPLHAEVWNAPTWFLSSMSFALIAMPSAISTIAQLDKKGLRQAMGLLSVTLLLPRLAYSYDLGVWSVMEGLLSARTHPNIALWNTIRFNPLYALLEMLIGVVACRMVMLDTDEDGQEAESEASFLTSPIWPLLGMAAVLGLRAFGVLGLNDPLTRSLLFLPLFTRFLVAAHRQTLRDTPGKPSVTRALAWGPLTYLGTISFPIFVLHGPLGQLLYKKVIASNFVWGACGAQMWFFGVYIALTISGGAALHWAVLSRKWAADLTKSTTAALCRVFQ